MNGSEKNNSGSQFMTVVGKLGLKNKSLSKKKTADSLLQANKLEIWTVDNKIIPVDLNRIRLTKGKETDVLVRDVVRDACRQLNIYPKTSTFFGLSNENNWLIQTKRIDTINSKYWNKLVLTLQFKVLSSNELRKFDETAYLYYVKQCRYIFKNGLLQRQLESRENEKILLRMVILEMMMVAKEENVLPLKDVLKSKNKKIFNLDEIVKKYNDVQGPRDVSKCKQKVEKSLNCFSKVAEPDKDFVTEVELLSHYREEIFHIKKYEGERKDNPNNIELWITPTKIMKRAIIGNVKMTLWESPYEMFHRFKDITDDKTDSKKGKRIMVLRGREPPEMMYCFSDDQVESLFSFVDGYFQLLVNQYDTLLNEMLTSNILTKHVYHGPIEREVALQILTSKGREPGTYLLREHTTQHDCFVLSLIREDDTFAHVVIRQKIDDNKVIFNIDDKRKFQDLNELQEFYKNPDNSAEIKACLQKGLSPKIVVKVPMYTDPVNFRPPPPSRKNHIEINSSISPCLLDSNRMELKHLKNGAFGDVFKSEAQISDERREVIVKRYPTLKSDMLNDVATLLMQIQDDLRILPFVGMSVTGDLFLAFEYLPLGSLEKFLELNRSQVTYGGLLKYLLQITEAVTYLHTKNLIHADLRLSKFFMKDPKTIKLSDCCITWKLSTFKKLDERIFQKRYKHLAPEIFLQQNQLFTQKTDVWAFGLTMWQLFTLVRPFKNYTSTQLMTFFREHMKMNEEPSLNYLNMNILFFCPDKLLNVFTKSLHTREDKRCNMIEIQQAVIDLHRKTPTIHKEKSYFLHDWESEMKQKPVQPPVDPSYYADSAGSLATTNDGGNTTDGSFSDAYTINEGLTSARSDVSNVQEMNGAGYIATSSRPVLDESSDKESDGDLISPVRPKNADTSSTTDGTTTATVSDEQASSTLDNKSTVDDAESPYLTMSTAGSPSDLVTPAMPVTSKTDERMDVDVTSLTSKDTTLTASSSSLPRHGMSRSAPSSPSRPRIFRATSANSNEDSGGDKRGEQDLETASILVDMSQTKLAHKGGEGSTPQGKRPLPNHHLPPGHPSQKQAVLCVPQGYSIVGRVGAPISGQPVRFFNPPPQHPHRSHHFQDGVKRSKALQRPPIKQPPIAPPPQNDDSPLSPPPPPPDSPDSSRRDYSDPPKREIPRDDKTRLFLQEKINKERDRFRGKRSISFNEEFDEYKNSTRKAAKRALLSANPFNLGIKVPDNFLMRPEKRLHPQTKSISAGVMKFFASSLDEKAVKENEQQLINGKSPSKNPSQYESPYRSIADIEIQRNQRYPPGQPPPGTVPLPPNSASQHNPALDPYKTSEDLRKYRESALMKPNEEMNRKPEMQTIVQGIQDMHAHSPKDLSYEENRLPANRPPERRMYASESIRPDLSATSTMTTTTINGFLQAHPHGISSIFMPVQQVRFPYGHPTDPSQSPYQLPPSSTLVTRPVTNGKKITSGVAAIYPPPGNYQILPAMHVQTHGDRTRPIIMAANPPPHVRPRIQPAQPTLHSGKYPSVPPNLQRFDSRVAPGIYTTDHPRMPVSDSHAPYTALQNIRSSESSQIGYQKLDPSNVPKLDNVISFGNKSATTIPAPQPIVKKEPVDSDYSPSMNRTEKQGSDYSSNMNRTEKQGPLSPAGLFSPTEPKLFQPNVHKPVLKKHISRINLKFDRKKDLIGKGQFGVVYKAKWMFADPSTKQKKEVDVAVKTLHEDNPLTDEAMDDLRKEADAMAILTSESLTENEGSKHILKMYGVCDDHKSPKKFSIITERAQGGALDTYLYKNKASLGDNGFGYCLFYARQIAIGMEYLHSLNLIHRDLACRNILVMDRELVKISDFGLSRIFTDSEYYRTTKDKKLPFHWMAIETIGNLKYTKETDYWSYGVLLWEALTVLDKDFQRPKVLPYKEIPNDELHSYLDKGNRLAKPKGCPDKLYNDIMLKCWDRDPQQRPTFYRSNKALKDLMDEINFCVGQ